ncbi:MAG: hypothetical protein KAU62_12535 [Candidatus Heimdallarchaeota archaeon]|nr:hypothetical protein [Candidatus Heimdallarchaeota archaeon]MCK4611977.1 hypothetical protein [Candidatus Heimdallarchaeota archaeon]
MPETEKKYFFRKPRYLKREVKVEATDEPFDIFRKLDLEIVGFDPKIDFFVKLPDLVVLAYSTGYDGTDYVIKLKVGNIGYAPSPNGVLVYINAISDVFHPGVNEIRIQESYALPLLNPGDDYDHLIKFPLREMHAKEVNRFHVIVDPKGQVMELREDNNEEKWYW